MENEISQKALPIKDEAKDFYGKVCTEQPQGDELLVLSRGPFSSGCDKQDYGPGDGSTRDFDVLKLYKEARPSIVYFQMKGTTEGGGKQPAGKEFNWGGSGFIIEAENGKSLIVTDNHVVAGTGMDSKVKVNETKVVLADGEVLDGKIVAADPTRDLALVEIDTGEKTKEIDPIEIPDKMMSPDGSPALVSFGQPYTSHTIYTSEGTADRIVKRSDFNRVIKPLDGEDPNRPVLVMMLPVRTGFSGAAVLDKDGKAVAVVDLETSPFSSLGTPIDKEIINEMKAKRIAPQDGIKKNISSHGVRT